jgi:NAD(P)-dependent dehydrogenase (short-subunit alcohol dehydrogenase family)
MGRAIIVTGPTRGLGLATVRAILRRAPDATLILAGRNREALAMLARRLGKARPRAQLLTVELDLQSTASVRRCAAAVRELAPDGLEAMILSAGLQFPTGELRGEGGVELTFANNHLGHYLLANLLAGHMTPEGRIVFVASGTHDPAQKTGLPPPQLRTARDAAFPGETGRQEPPGIAGRRAYSTSKLCNVLCAYELDRRIQLCGRSGPSVLAFDPGLMPGTGLARSYPPLLQALWSWVLPTLIPVLRLVMGPNVHRPAVSGANLARLALDPSVHGWTGVYVEGRSAIRSSEVSYDRELQADLWALSAELTGLAPDEGEFAWRAVAAGPPVRPGPEPESFTTLRLPA